VNHPRIQVNNTETYKEGDYLIRSTIANAARLQLPQGNLHGSIIDIDVFKEQYLSFDGLFADMEKLHRLNKDVFFASLEPNYLTELGPQYE
jgi:uncharacterized protein (TIGR04255 family)